MVLSNCRHRNRLLLLSFCQSKSGCYFLSKEHSRPQGQCRCPSPMRHAGNRGPFLRQKQTNSDENSVGTQTTAIGHTLLPLRSAEVSLTLSKSPVLNDLSEARMG